MGVGATPGTSQAVKLAFRTNIPDQPTKIVEIVVPRVKSGVWAEPKTVVFGDLESGHEATQIVEIYNGGLGPRTIQSVKSSYPEEFAVRLVPLSKEESSRVSESAGALIAKAEIRALAKFSRPFYGDIRVQLANDSRTPDLIPVLGRVVGSVESRPDILVFPRHVGDQFVDSGDVVIFSRNGKPLSVEIGELPLGIYAKAYPVPDRRDRCSVRVECRRVERNKSKVPSRAVVRLRVNSGGETTDLNLPIFVAEVPK